MTMQCQCGNTITERQDKQNDEIAKDSNTKKVNMCDSCWEDYCHHALTGD